MTCAGCTTKDAELKALDEFIKGQIQQRKEWTEEIERLRSINAQLENSLSKALGGM